MRRWFSVLASAGLLIFLTGAESGGAGCIGFSYAECNPGQTQACYTGPVVTKNKGLCKDGMQTCTEKEVWGECQGQVLPQESDECSGEDRNCDGITESKATAEQCNGLDDNCDGKVDE
ncbi:MAG: hypothetical protein AAGJ35_11350, partial [Myxococcota bacterium]